MSKIYRPTFVEISLDLLKSNYDLFAHSALGRIFMCPMVKANAYGHGDVQIVKYLESFGCETFGVGLVEEGIRLRERGHERSQILVFGFTGREAVEEILHWNLIPVISDWQQLELISQSARKTIGVHLKFNTGMNRLGFTPEQAPKVFEAILSQKKLRVLGMGTHLMSSEDLQDPQGVSVRQLQLFRKLLVNYNHPCVFHAYNTSGALNALAKPDLISQFPYGLRIGFGLYGLASGDAHLGDPLTPVACLKSKIVAIQNVKKGEFVSYGGTWTAQRDSVIAIVPIGYADGIPVQLSNRGHVMVQDQLCPIVGRVCMDYTLVDVTGISMNAGMEVEFFGRHRTAHDVAREAQTISYDILTRLSERVPRVFVGRSS